MGYDLLSVLDDAPQEVALAVPLPWETNKVEPRDFGNALGVIRQLSRLEPEGAYPVKATRETSTPNKRPDVLHRQRYASRRAIAIKLWGWFVLGVWGWVVGINAVRLYLGFDGRIDLC